MHATLRRLAQRTSIPARVRDVLVRREWYLWRIGGEIWPRIAPFYRPLLRNTVFIGVTGSCGKSTTKELIGGILGSAMSGRTTPNSLNQPTDVAHTVLRTRPLDRYSVHEIGLGKHGEREKLENSVRILRPRIGVVTTIGDDHASAYGSREAVAQEKAKLIAALPGDGTAVLNADDPLVSGMRGACKGRVITYGLAEEAMVRAVDVRSRWPARLAFTVVHEGQSMHVQTQLLGEHWVTAALAAIATALAVGMPLASVAKALTAIEPVEGRMNPATRADGVTFVRDDVKAPLWTIPVALDFLAKAAATRKILVVGTLSDYSESHRAAYVSVAKRALEVADHAIFVSAHAWQVLRARRDPHDIALQAFTSLHAAHAYLATLVQPGDLVLLKGHGDDLLWRLARYSPGEPDARSSVSQATTDRPLAVIGLGNPGPDFEGTRHNIGQAVVDRLAERLHSSWSVTAEATLARIEYEGVPLYLVKPLGAMNHTGPLLRLVSDELGLVPSDCIVVHDEIKLDVGRVRARMEGGHGGHRGVRSILESFDDHRFRRVKVGVGLPGAGTSVVDHVLSRFRANEIEPIEKACGAAVEQVLLFLGELLADRRKSPASREQRIAGSR